MESPVLAFISLERYNAVKLVQAVHTGLASLNRVLRGSSLLTTDVQSLGGALLQHQVCGVWCVCVGGGEGGGALYMYM